MFIDVSDELRITIDGRPFDLALTVEQLHAVLGPPTRIVDPVPPAPVGHRNNHLHVYDSSGVYFNEHHHTRRLQDCTVVFWPDEQGFSFTPLKAFSGRLRIAGYDVPPQPALLPLLKGCSIGLRQYLPGHFNSERNDSSMILTARGAKLRSGRRSKILGLVSVSFSWPHDPWDAPAIC